MIRLSDELPEPPYFDIEVLGPREDQKPGFLRYQSQRVRTVDAQGRRSRELIYDQVDRRALDAVVVAAHFVAENAQGQATRYVVLRSAIRPPVALRDEKRSPLPEPKNRGLWEVPAGLIEPTEQSPTGIVQAAIRELLEETGLAVSPQQMLPLGPSAFPAPGVIAERHFYFHAQVQAQSAGQPALDGSALEEAGEVIAVPLLVVLQEAEKGRLADSKTELALRRLKDVLSCEKDVL